MKLGRIHQTPFAYGVVTIDGDFPDEVLKSLINIPEIVEARSLRIH
jgi:hypothetical protein